MNVFRFKRLGALALALVMALTLLPAAAFAASRKTREGDTVRYKLKAGSSISLDRADFKDVFSAAAGSDDSLLYIELEAGSNYKYANGLLYADFDSRNEVSFNANDLDDETFYYSSGSYGDYAINDLTFAAGSSGNGKTVSMTYYAYGSDYIVEGTLNFVIGTSDADQADVGIIYTVGAGDAVTLSRNDFKTLYEKTFSDTFRFMILKPNSGSNESYGRIYYNYETKSEKAFYNDELEDYQFYFSNSDYGDYPINSITFAAAGGSKGRIVSYNYELHGEEKTLKGALEFHIGSAGSSSGSSTASGYDLSYTVRAGKELTFDKTDFQSIFSETYTTGSVRSISFEPRESMTSSTGLFYVNYGYSKEHAFNKTTINSYSFYYSNEDFGDYALDELSFVAPNSAQDLVIDFSVYGSNNKTVEGTMRIQTTGSSSGSGSSSSSSTNAKSDISYTVRADKQLELKKSDFLSYFRKTYTGASIASIVFEPRESMTASTTGLFYANYDSKNEKSFTKYALRNYLFYYSDESEGDYDIAALSYVAPSKFKDPVYVDFTINGENGRSLTGVLGISEGASASDGSNEIVYEVKSGKTALIDKADLQALFRDVYEDETVRTATLNPQTSLSESTGLFYVSYGLRGEKSFTKYTLRNYNFYYSNESFGDYYIGDLVFVAPPDFSEDIVLDLSLTGSNNKTVNGTIRFTANASSSSSGSSGSSSGSRTYDMTYTLSPGDELVMGGRTFREFFRDSYANTEIAYVEFVPEVSLSADETGMFYIDYSLKSEKSFKNKTIADFYFYYSDEADGDYALDDLSFVAPDTFTTEIPVAFTVYGTNNRKVTGRMLITPNAAVSSTADILYYSTSSNLQLNSNDFARFFRKTYPRETFLSVTLGGIPETGALYYNYYNASAYGPGRTLLTSALLKSMTFQFSPETNSSYSLTELTYVPTGVNYCVTIPFTANGATHSVSGNLFISITSRTISDVYGVTPKDNAVTFPSSAISTAINAGVSGQSVSSVRLLRLPDSKVGTVYEGGTSSKATTSDRYNLSGSGVLLGSLRFVPATGYTGSVEIPYAAYNANGSAIGAGKFSLGIVSERRTFKDITSSTWCYKYVSELSAAGVIDGYTDGSFKPDNQVTWGQALKLIMLAAGYPVQQPTDTKSVFSGYLARAKADGLVTGDVTLTAPISRQAVAQLAAKALKLSTSGLSTVQPFTDTSDAYVRALNAAGIVEGYFSQGVSTFRPANTLTRGQASAIVWRMQQYRAQ